MVKGLKTLNPADKARREARKKELKKNKKQRQQVRSAVIEKKDPEQIIADLEKLDKLEFDVESNPSMSDGFYKDKRKRLKENWTRLLEYYQKEDPDKHAKLKKIEINYEANYRRLVKEFDAIKAAKEVKIEDVFLPPESNSALAEIADDDPLMSETIYIIATAADGPKPPGCPPGPPPDLKLLAESLRVPQVAAVQPIPTNLMNLSSDQVVAPIPTYGGHQQPKNRFRPDRTHRELRAETQAIGQTVKRPESYEHKPAPVPTKPAIIESKPVIFMPKATKFVPASVRTKLNKDPGR